MYNNKHNHYTVETLRGDDYKLYKDTIKFLFNQFYLLTAHNDRWNDEKRELWSKNKLIEFLEETSDTYTYQFDKVKMNAFNDNRPIKVVLDEAFVKIIIDDIIRELPEK